MAELYPSPVVIGDPDRCAGCGKLIGRAGRTDEEVLAAVRAGEFRTSFGLVDWSATPPTMTCYCGECGPR